MHDASLVRIQRLGLARLPVLADRLRQRRCLAAQALFALLPIAVRVYEDRAHGITVDALQQVFEGAQHPTLVRCEEVGVDPLEPGQQAILGLDDLDRQIEVRSAAHPRDDFANAFGGILLLVCVLRRRLLDVGALARRAHTHHGDLGSPGALLQNNVAELLGRDPERLRRSLERGFLACAVEDAILHLRLFFFCGAEAASRDRSSCIVTPCWTSEQMFAASQ